MTLSYRHNSFGSKKQKEAQKRDSFSPNKKETLAILDKGSMLIPIILIKDHGLIKSI